MKTLRRTDLGKGGSLIAALPDHPAFPAAIAVGSAICFVFLRLELFAHGDVTRFIDAGRSFVNPARAPGNLKIVPGSGYDGEFYYRLALDPANLHRTAFGITFDNASRVQRIAYSAIAWLVSGGGRVTAVPWALVTVNVLGLGAIAWLGGVIARDAKRPAVYGLLVAGYFGFLFTLGRDLTEITAATFLLAGIVALRRERPVLAGFLLAAAALSRETALAFSIAVGIVAVAQVLGGAEEHGDVLDVHAAAGDPLELGIRLVVKILGQILRRRVHLCKRLQIVDHLMIEPLDDMLHHLAQIFEVEQQPSLVEFFAGQRDPDLIVVPMRVLTLPLVIAEVVSRGKRVFDSDFKHGACSLRIHCIATRSGRNPKPVGTREDHKGSALPLRHFYSELTSSCSLP